MPIVDNDRVAIINKSREGSSNIQVEFDWFDSSGALKGRYTLSWATVEEFQEFLNSGQGFEDVGRALLLQCLNRQNGQFRGGVFDGLTGSYEIRQRVVPV